MRRKSTWQADKLLWTQSKARKHAAQCRRCFVPIIDEEGNPGLFSEACPEGYQLLRAYVDAERAILSR